MSSMQTSVEAVRKSLVVECSPERAFEVFTREVGSWWPLHVHSIGGNEMIEPSVRSSTPQVASTPAI